MITACVWISVFACCSYGNHKGTYRGRDKVLFESNKFRLLNELHCLEETIMRRQQELHEVEQVLEKHQTELTAVQIEVPFSFLICVIITIIT